MKLEQLVRIFDTLPGARKEGSAYLIPDEVDVSIFFSLPAEVITVQRVARVDPSGEFLSIDTHKSERFVFLAEALIGVKSEGSAKKGVGRGAGFR